MTAPRRILAVDYGRRRTGLAATDWTGTIRVPLPRIDTADRDALIDELAALCRERDTEHVVVGLPLVRDGEIGEQAAATLAFVERLRARLTVPVSTVDESSSTDEAHARLADLGLKAAQRRKVADSVAALVILERALATLGR